MDSKQALAMWRLGFGDQNNAFFGIETPAAPGELGGTERKPKRAIKSDWKIQEMPAEQSVFAINLPISADEFETLAWGHIPQTMEDHWFMYFDGEALCFHRSYSGLCIFRVLVKRAAREVAAPGEPASESAGKGARDGYVLYQVVANRAKDQVGDGNDARDAVLVAILIGQALNQDVSDLWKQFFMMG